MPDLNRRSPKWLRVTAWLAVVGAIGFAFSIAVQVVFHAPLWITLPACFLLGWFMPVPRWAKWVES